MNKNYLIWKIIDKKGGTEVYFFTVAWEEYGKEPKLHIETAKNSYVVLLNQ